MIKPKADCIYGATGSTKTSNLGLAALYYYEKHGLKTRIVTADGGGVGPLDPLIEAGIVDVFTVLHRKFPIEAMDWCSQGYWPTDLDDPNGAMVPPTPDSLKGIGLIGFEGLTSFGDKIMARLKEDRAKLSQDASFIYVEGSDVGRATADKREAETKKELQREGAIAYAGGNMTYYGFVQDQIYKMVMNSHRIPNPVLKVIWTALEAKGEDEQRSPIYGPAISGKKATGKAGQWFCNLFHLEQVLDESKQDAKNKQLHLNTRPVLYLRPHADPNNKIPFPAKVRAPFQFQSKVPHTIEPPNLMEAYKLLDSLHERAVKSLKEGGK